jgi:hypothetical protein
MNGLLKVAATPSSQDRGGDAMVACGLWRAENSAYSSLDKSEDVAHTLCDEASHLLLR